MFGGNNEIIVDENAWDALFDGKEVKR
jgi:hypothetical protein